MDEVLARQFCLKFSTNQWLVESGFFCSPSDVSVTCADVQAGRLLLAQDRDGFRRGRARMSDELPLNDARNEEPSIFQREHIHGIPPAWYSTRAAHVAKEYPCEPCCPFSEL